MTIEVVLDRIATALEVLASSVSLNNVKEAAGTAPVVAASPPAPAAAVDAAPAASDTPAVKKRGRPAGSTKAATTSAEPVTTSTTATVDPAVPSTPTAPVVEADDDFLGESKPAEMAVKEATIEEARAALMAYRDRRVAHYVSEGKATDAAAHIARTDAIAMLKKVSGVENFTAFTDKSLYGVLVAAAGKDIVSL